MNDELEQMIDKHGLCKVLLALSEICGEKAEHLRSNWQDNQAGKLWDYDAKRLDAVAAKVDH